MSHPTALEAASLSAALEEMQQMLAAKNQEIGRLRERNLLLRLQHCGSGPLDDAVDMDV
jgi:hypothetical protein